MSDSMIGMRGELTNILRAEVLLIPSLGMIFICNAMLQALRLPMMALFITFARTGLTTLSFALLSNTSIITMCISMTCIYVAASVAAYLITRKAIDITERKECRYNGTA